MAGKNISVKAHMDHEGGSTEVRRFGLDSSAATSFAYLQGKLRLAFPRLMRQPMEVAWLDGDQDWVTLSTDEELVLALTDTLQVRSLPTLRLKVSLASLKPLPTPADTDGPVHSGVCCDACNETVRGYRYKCLTCEDFDLCGACEAQNAHPEHVMVRIANPELAWQRLVRMGRRGGWRGPQGGRPGSAGPCGAGGFSGAGAHCPWKGRGRQHGKPDPAEEATKAGNTSAAGASASNPGQDQSQRPKTFFDAINAAMTALGGFPAEPAGAAGNAASRWTEKNLEQLGQTIAACLDPFGIDVDVGVGSRNKSPADKPKTNEKPAAAPEATPPQQQQQQQQPTPTPSARQQPDAVVTQQPVMMETEPAADAAGVTPIPITVDDEPNDDWTVVSRSSTPSVTEGTGTRPRVYPNLASDAPQAAAASAASVAAAAASAAAAAANAAVALGAEAVTAAPALQTAAATAPSAPTPDDTLEPRIQRALQVMGAMGFSNDGGWLTQLLQAKQGDIGAVLDVLQPVRPRQPQTY